LQTENYLAKKWIRASPAVVLLQSGRSDHQNLTVIKVPFRPKAVIDLDQFEHQSALP